MNNNQLTDFHNFDTKRILFSHPEIGNIPGSKLTFKRIRISVRNLDGTIGDLILATPPNLFCFGLQESTDQTTGNVNGYQFPLVLWNKNEPTEDEKLFTQVIHNISDHCKEYLVSHREKIQRYDLEMNDLKKFNPLYYKMEKGKIVEGKGPMFYIKTLSSKKDGNIRINTMFLDEETCDVIPPLDLLGKRCHVQGAIKVESIFIGTKISLQTKLYEAKVRIMDTGFRSLLNPNKVFTKEKTLPTFNFEDTKSREQESEDNFLLKKEDVPPFVLPTSTQLQDDTEEDSSSDEEEEEWIPPPSTPIVTEKKEKAPVRRTVVRKNK
jgi:hypothetical protein